MKEPEIHVFRPVFRVDECLAELRECLERGWTGLGWKTVKFEDAWKAYTGLPHAHFVSSGTAALQIALRALRITRGWKPGDEVITTPLTFVSTNEVILEEGLTPVFADVDEYLCLNPGEIARLFGPKTRAVVFVGLGGQTGRFQEVVRDCRRLGLALILDGAHLAGARIDGRHVGREADAACFSFHPVKNLGTGDSGMVSFKDPDLDALGRQLSWHGIDRDTWSRATGPVAGYRWRYSVRTLGFKYNGNSIQAALGLVGLKYLESDNDRRRQIHARYEKGLALRPPGLDLIPVPQGCVPSGHMFRVLSERRDELIEYLNSKSIFPGVHYDLSTVYPVFAPYARSCPAAALASGRLLTLPCHLAMTDKDVDRVAGEVLEFHQSVSGP